MYIITLSFLVAIVHLPRLLLGFSSRLLPGAAAHILPMDNSNADYSNTVAITRNMDCNPEHTAATAADSMLGDSLNMHLDSDIDDMAELPVSASSRLLHQSSAAFHPDSYRICRSFEGQPVTAKIAGIATAIA
jgi:hypothetical protein